MSKGEDHAAFGDLRQDRRLLFFVAGEPQRRAAKHDRGQIRLQCEDAPERLHHQHHLDRAAAEAAIIFGKGQAQQTKFGILCPEAAAPTLGLGEIGAALVKSIMVGEQPLDRVAQQPLLFAQIEIHRSAPQGYREIASLRSQ